MANTFIPISTYTVGSGGVATIDFTSIPQTYTDLCLRSCMRAEGSATAPSLYIKFNSSTTTFTDKYIQGNGAAVISGSVGSGYIGNFNGGGTTASVFDSTEVYIPNYTSAANHPFSSANVMERNDATAYQLLVAGLWSTANAITSITLYLGATDIAEHSTATLYGIKSS
jgi:hypothetical protein